MRRNVFVIAMDEFNLATMQSLREADRYINARLSEMRVQESYSYELGRVHVGAEDHVALEQAWSEIEDMLSFEIA